MARSAQDSPEELGRFRGGAEGPAPPLPKPRFRHDVPILSAALSWDGKVLVAADAGGELLGWDRSSSRLLYRVRVLGKDEPPPRLVCSPDNRFLAVSPRTLPPGPVRVLELRSGREVRRIDRGFRAVFSHDAEFLAASDGNSVRRWAMKSGAELPSLEAVPQDLKFVTWSPKGDRLAASSQGSADVEVWDLATRRRLSPGVFKTGGLPAQSLVISPDGKTLAVGGHWGLRFFNLTGEADPLFEGHEEYATGQLR